MYCILHLVIYSSNHLHFVKQYLITHIHSRKPENFNALSNIYNQYNIQHYSYIYIANINNSTPTQMHIAVARSTMARERERENTRERRKNLLLQEHGDPRTLGKFSTTDIIHSLTLYSTRCTHITILQFFFSFFLWIFHITYYTHTEHYLCLFNFCKVK